MIRADQILPGMQFKRPKQTYWREAKRIIDLSEVENVPAHQKGKLLIILTTCRQIVVAKDELFIVPAEEETPKNNYKSLSNN